MRRFERGQSMVELALVLPLVLVVVLGLVDLGRIVFVNNTLSDGARHGARHAAIDPGNCGLISQSVRTAILGTDLTTFRVTYSTIDDLGVTTGTYLLCNGGTAGPDLVPREARPGDRVTVDLEASLPLATPFIAAASGHSTFDLKAESTMQVTFVP